MLPGVLTCVGGGADQPLPCYLPELPESSESLFAWTQELRCDSAAHPRGDSCPSKWPGARACHLGPRPNQDLLRPSPLVAAASPPRARTSPTSS